MSYANIAYFETNVIRTVSTPVVQNEEFCLLGAHYLT